MIRRSLLLLAVLLPLTVEGYYYLNGWLDGRDTSFLVMYRPTIGDRDYFPIVHQLSQLRAGEGYTTEYRDTGFISFPWASVLPHTLAMAVLGSVGFAVADILVPCGYCALFALFLLRAGASQGASWTLAVFSTLFGFKWLGRVLLSVSGYALDPLPYYLDFLQSWNLRFPRPFVSDLYVLGATAWWIVLARRGWPEARMWWLAVGVWMAAVLQSDIYAFTVLGLLFPGAALAWLISGRHWPSASQLRNLALCLATFVLLITPFLLARWLEHPDIAPRYGVFQFPGDPTVLIGVALRFFPASFVLLSLAVPVLACMALRRNGRWDEHLTPRTAASFVALQVASYLAMFAFVSASGQGVQLHHFRDSVRCFTSMSVIATAGLFGAALLARVGVKHLRLRNLAVGTVAALVAVGVLRHSLFYGRLHLDNPATPRNMGVAPPAWESSARPAIPRPALLQPILAPEHAPSDRAGTLRPSGVNPPTTTPTYRRDFEALGDFLTVQRQAGAQSLATLEVELFSWWTAFRDGSSFLAHGFVSTVPNSVLETRLCQFAKLNQIAAGRFVEFLESSHVNTVINNWQSVARYQANNRYTFARLSDYSPEQRTRIAAAGLLDCWHLEIPLSEQRRLEKLYASTTLPHPNHALGIDLLVLSDEFPQLQPDPSYFAAVYRNPTFRVYRPRSSVNPPASL